VIETSTTPDRPGLYFNPAGFQRESSIKKVRRPALRRMMGAPTDWGTK